MQERINKSKGEEEINYTTAIRQRIIYNNHNFSLFNFFGFSYAYYMCE